MSVVEEKESYAIARTGGIGGSDMAALIGLSPWRRPIDVWDAKINPEKQPELSAEHLRWGTLLEPVIRNEYAAKFGVKVVDPVHIVDYFPNTAPWRDSTIIIGREPWMLGTPDGWIPSHMTGFEAKAVGRRNDDWGAEGSDDIPAHYMVQDAWYMEVCMAPRWNMGVLFAGQKLEQFTVRRDLGLGNDLVEAARAFWFDYILPKKEPPLDESENYGKYLARKFSLNKGTIITEPTEEMLGAVCRLKEAEENVKAAEQIKQRWNNELRALVGDAWKMNTPFGAIGWVRPSAGERVDYKAIVEELNPDTELLKKHTTPTQTSPYLRAWWKKEGK